MRDACQSREGERLERGRKGGGGNLLTVSPTQINNFKIRTLGRFQDYKHRKSGHEGEITNLSLLTAEEASTKKWSNIKLI